MVDINAVYLCDAFPLVTGPSSAIASLRSIAEYGHRPTPFHHIAQAAKRALVPVLAFSDLRVRRQALALADATKTLNVASPRQPPD
jgi:hypothetical protein